jgi:hypothetical protein
MINRRSLITGLAALIAAPAIVKADNLMKVRTPTIISGIDFGSGDFTVNYITDPGHCHPPFLHINCRCYLDEMMNEISIAYQIPRRMLLGQC